MPPIQIQSQTPNETTTLMKEIGITNFSIKRINEDKHSLLTPNHSTFLAAKEHLSKADSPFFTYTPKADKPKTAILRGLSRRDSPEEILRELQNLNKPGVNPTHVRRHTTPYSVKNGFTLSLFNVQFSPDSEWNELVKIQILNHQVISWEKPHHSQSISQCVKCQRYGHTATNCNLGYRCVKCPIAHEPFQCPRQKFADREQVDENDNTDKRPYCINCKSLGHPASYKGCPHHVTLLAKLTAAKNNKKSLQTPASRTFSSEYIKENISYANVLGRNPQPSTIPQLPSMHGTAHINPHPNTVPQSGVEASIKALGDKLDKHIARSDAKFEQMMSLIHSILASKTNNA